MTLRRFFSTTPRRCGRRTWTTRTTTTSTSTPEPTATTTTLKKNNNNNNNNTWCVGSGVRIYSTSSRNVFDVDDEDKEYAEREKKFTLRRKLFRESLKVKNLERANGFTRKNLDASATALGMSPSVVDAMMDGEETVKKMDSQRRQRRNCNESSSRERLRWKSTPSGGRKRC